MANGLVNELAGRCQGGAKKWANKMPQTTQHTMDGDVGRMMDEGTKRSGGVGESGPTDECASLQYQQQHECNFHQTKTFGKCIKMPRLHYVTVRAVNTCSEYPTSYACCFSSWYAASRSSSQPSSSWSSPLSLALPNVIFFCIEHREITPVGSLAKRPRKPRYTAYVHLVLSSQ